MKIYNVNQIADALFVNRETVRRWCRTGRLKTEPIISCKFGFCITSNDIINSEIYNVPKYRWLFDRLLNNTDNDFENYLKKLLLEG